MSKAALLDELLAEMKGNGALPLGESNLVFGEGNINALVMFIGEAPGFHEDRLGRPFVGRGGQLLDDCIKSIGWKREDVYITNIVKRRPPENRDPSPEEIEAYKPYLTRQIEIVSPKVVAPLGRFAMNYFLPLAKITRDQGKGFLVDGRIIFPLFHPAAALRSTEVMNEFKKSFTKLPDIVKNDEAEIAPAIEQKPKPENSQTSLF